MSQDLLPRVQDGWYNTTQAFFAETTGREDHSLERRKGQIVSGPLPNYLGNTAVTYGKFIGSRGRELEFHPHDERSGRPTQSPVRLPSGLFVVELREHPQGDVNMLSSFLFFSCNAPVRS